MSYQRTIEGLRILNRELEALYDSGQPLMLDVNGAPVMRIDSFDPLVYEKYGRFLNRAPRIVGGAALRAFLSAPMPDNDAGAQVWAGVQTEGVGYGLVIHPIVMEDVARSLGLKFRISPVN